MSRLCVRISDQGEAAKLSIQSEHAYLGEDAPLVHAYIAASHSSAAGVDSSFDARPMWRKLAA